MKSSFDYFRPGIASISSVGIRGFLLVFAPLLIFSQPLPPDAVQLSRVKIVETQKAADLCPVHLVPSDPQLPGFSHEGIEYRGHQAGCQEEFESEPLKYVERAKYQRWENNFCSAMSPIWCPVTDQINPGNWNQWQRHGLTWESCCQFCNAEVFEGCFDIALVRLKQWAKVAYQATGGVYSKNVESPIAGALRIRGSSNTARTTQSLPSTTTGRTAVGTSEIEIVDARFDRARGQWRHYGGDRSHARYSPLNQINKQTVNDLKVVWKWKSVDSEISRNRRSLRSGQFKSTPLMANGVLYTSTSFSQIAALDPATRETIWVHDPKSYERGRPANSGFQHRGLEYWTDGEDERIIIATGGRQLVAVNAKTGQPYPDFGDNG